MSAWLAAVVVAAAAAAMRLARGLVDPARRTRSRRVARRARARQATPSQLAGRLELIARALRGGASLRAALVEGERGPHDPMAPVVRRVGAGAAVRDALVAWPEARVDGDLRLAAAGLLAAAVVGGPQARIVDAAAVALRERAGEAAERRAHAAPAKASAVVLVALPLVASAWSCVADRRVAAFVFTQPAGVACTVAGLGLVAVGAWWMARLVRGDER